MFEYQTAISELTGLPVSNASVYEGPSAVAAAGYVAKPHERPNALRHLPGRPSRTRASACARSPTRGGWRSSRLRSSDGATDLPELDDDVSAVIVQQPNFLGAVEDLTALADAAKQAGALTIAPATRCRWRC